MAEQKSGTADKPKPVTEESKTIAADQHPSGAGKVEPQSSGDDVLARAQKRAPSLTAEFADRHELSDEFLEGIASGLIPPPPTNGPIHTTDLHFVNGMWQQTPVGVAPEDVEHDIGAYGPKV